MLRYLLCAIHYLMPFLVSPLGCIFMGAVLFVEMSKTVGQRTSLNSCPKCKIPSQPSLELGIFIPYFLFPTEFRTQLVINIIAH